LNIGGNLSGIRRPRTTMESLTTSGLVCFRIKSNSIRQVKESRDVLQPIPSAEFRDARFVGKIQSLCPGFLLAGFASVTTMF
jgi:hypothetical protein